MIQMRTFRHYSPLIAVYVLMLGILLGAASTAGCTKDTRSTTLHAAVLATDAASEGFLAYDETRITQIVKDAPSREVAEANLAAYYVKSAKVQTAKNLVYRALALAATQTDALSLKAAMDQIAELIATIATIQKTESTPEKAP